MNADFAYLFASEVFGSSAAVEKAARDAICCAGALLTLDGVPEMRAGPLRLPQLARHPDLRASLVADLLFPAYWHRVSQARLQRTAQVADLFVAVLQGVEHGTARTLDTALLREPRFLGTIELDPQSPLHRRFVYDALPRRFWLGTPAEPDADVMYSDAGPIVRSSASVAAPPA